MDGLISIDRSDGRVMVLSISFPAALKRVNNSWNVGAFSADDLKDNFERVLDPKEEETLFHEAKAALESNPSLLRLSTQP